MPLRLQSGSARSHVPPPAQKSTSKTGAAATSNESMPSMIPATSSSGQAVLLPATDLTQPSPQSPPAIISHRCHKSGHVFRIIRQHLYLICSYPTDDSNHTVCGFTTYGGPAKMRNHIRTHALRAVNALFACPTCSGRFSRRGAIATHQCDKLRGQQSIDKEFDELVKTVKEQIEMTFKKQSHADSAVRAVWVANNNLLAKESKSIQNAVFPDWVTGVMKKLSLREEEDSREAAVRCTGIGGNKRKRGIKVEMAEEEWLDAKVPATRPITPDVGNVVIGSDSPASLRNYPPEPEDIEQVGFIGEHQPFRPNTAAPPYTPCDPVIVHDLQHGRLTYNRSSEILVTLQEPITTPTAQESITPPNKRPRHFPTTTSPTTACCDFTEWCRSFDRAIETGYQSPFNQNFDAIVERAAKEEMGRYDETYSDVWHRYEQMDVQQYERECWDLYHPNPKLDPRQVAQTQIDAVTAEEESMPGVVGENAIDIVVQDEAEEGFRRWRSFSGYCSPKR